MENKSPGFVLERDQKTIIEELTNEEAGIIFKAIYEYETTKQEPKLDKFLRIVFKQFKIKLDFYDNAYLQKCLINKENAEKRWQNKNANACDRMQMDANKRKENKNKLNKSKLNQIKLNNNNTPKGVYSRVGLDETQLFSEIIACFNKVGVKEDSFVRNKKEFHFKNTKTNQELIQNILDQGYTKDDIMDVIYLKYDQWIENNDKNNKDMSTYYRPSTILGDKFDEYLQEAKMKEIS
ncbi:MAG: conserved phage C-terminal domain-containing protein [Clostridia bacterium]|nr:conserved phage C-terminal domain-containing protein [Clostridia bacterium]